MTKDQPQVTLESRLRSFTEQVQRSLGFSLNNAKARNDELACQHSL